MKARLAFAALALVAGTAGAQQQQPPATGGAGGTASGTASGSAMGSSMQDSTAMKSGMKKHSRTRRHHAKKKAMMADSASMKKPS